MTTLDNLRSTMIAVMKKHGLNPSRWAKLANTSEAGVRQFLNGDAPNISVAYLEKLGAVVGMSPIEFLAPPTLEPVTAPFIRIPIKGVVQAGYWTEAAELASDEWETVPLPKPDGHKSYFGLRVKGDSMDRLYPEGTILVCVPIHDYNFELKAGRRVIVQRRDACTEMFEATVKELEQTPDGRWWLCPRSTNPEHQSLPWVPGKVGDQAGADDMQVIAVVVMRVGMD